MDPRGKYIFLPYRFVYPSALVPTLQQSGILDQANNRSTLEMIDRKSEGPTLLRAILGNPEAMNLMHLD